jgi:hypothetical protein
MDRYDAILESEGLAPTTTFEEFISICRGQGAMAVLDRLADRNDDRLVRDFPRERALEMKRLLGVALHCLTEHQNVHSLHDRIG